MSQTSTLEQRVIRLEAEFAALKERVEHAGGPPQKSWLDNMIGCLADEPEFDEVLRLGRDFRDAQGTADDVEHRG